MVVSKINLYDGDFVGLYLFLKIIIRVDILGNKLLKFFIVLF